MNLSLLVVIFIVAINISLFILVLFQASKTTANKFFNIFLFSLTAWVILLFISEIPTHNDLLWNRLVFLPPVPISVSFLYFAIFFGVKKKNFEDFTRLNIVSGVLSVFFIVSSLTPYVVSNISRQNNELILHKGFLYLPLLLCFILFFIAGIVVFVVKYRRRTGIVKQQIRLLLFGIILTSSLAIPTNIIYPVITGRSDLSFLGPVWTIFIVGFTTYSIIRHRLMDVRLAIRALILRILVGLVLSLIFVLLFYLLFSFTDSDFSMSFVFTTSLILGLTLSFIFRPIETLIRSTTDPFLFQKEYSRRELVKTLGKTMAESIELPEIIKNIEDTLHQVMRVQYVKFDLFKNDQADHPVLMRQVMDTPEIIIYDELVRKMAQMKSEDITPRMEQVRDYMEEKDIAVVLPLTSTGGVVGIILLGEKHGKDAFTTTDVETLETLMYQAGVAIENATLYNDAKQFNKRLQKEITVATRDLQIRNRRLSVLRALDNIILNTPDLHEMAQKVVNLVSWEMGFVGALMVLLEEEEDKQYLRAIALSSSPTFEKVLKYLPISLSEYRIEYNQDPSNYFVKALRDNKPYYTTDFKDLYVPPLPPKLADTVQAVSQVKHNAVYPLYAKGKPLGAIAIALPRPFDEMTSDDHELIQSFLDETGIAIENVLLNEQILERNEQLRKANIRLRELDQMKDELVSIASHELRTPMTAIKSYLWMALHKEKDNLNENLQKYLERAFMSSDRMIDLVNDMLSASRLEGNRLELHINPLDVCKLINDTIIQLKPKADEKNLKLSFDEPEGDFPRALADEERFNEIMINLVGNALKYTDQGSITIELDVKKKKAPQYADNDNTSFVWISIVDTGRGIAKEDMSRLFKKFGKLEQGSFTKSAETGGTGLGLYITKGLVELHGGEIWVESEAGKGSVFTVSLPAEKKMGEST